jgi:predicted transcriptional regulator
MSVGELCIREVVITEKDASILEAARLMRRYHVGDLIVVERKERGNVPGGIITDRDIILNVVAEGRDATSTHVSDVFISDLATVKEVDSLYDTIHWMRSKGVRRIPVVDEDGYLTGVLSVDDILDYLSDELVTLSKLLLGQRVREEETSK